jgi:hypothetical protein
MSFRIRAKGPFYAVVTCTRCEATVEEVLGEDVPEQAFSGHQYACKACDKGKAPCTCEYCAAKARRH